MARPIMALGFIAALVLACDSNQPTETGSSASARALSAPRFAAAQATVGTLVSFRVPGANMASSLGFAESVDMKSMLRNGWMVGTCQLTFLILFSLLFA